MDGFAVKTFFFIAHTYPIRSAHSTFRIAQSVSFFVKKKFKSQRLRSIQDTILRYRIFFSTVACFELLMSDVTRPRRAQTCVNNFTSRW